MITLFKTEWFKVKKTSSFRFSMLLSFFTGTVFCIHRLYKYSGFMAHVEKNFYVDPLYQGANAWFRGYSSWNSLFGFSGASLDRMASVYWLPILIFFAFSWSLFSEKDNDYRSHVIQRVGWKKYYLSKYLAIFLAGALVGILPLLMSAVVMPLFIPSLTPDPGFMEKYGHMSALSDLGFLFYKMPFLYLVSLLGLNFINYGLWAVAGSSLGFFLRKKYGAILTVVLPYFFLQMVNYLAFFMGEVLEVSEDSLSPATFLQPVVAGGHRLLYVGIFFFLLILVVYFLGLWKGSRRDVL